MQLSWVIFLPSAMGNLKERKPRLKEKVFLWFLKNLGLSFSSVLFDWQLKYFVNLLILSEMLIMFPGYLQNLKLPIHRKAPVMLIIAFQGFQNRSVLPSQGLQKVIGTSS